MKVSYYIFDLPLQNLITYRGAFINMIQTILSHYQREELMLPMRHRSEDWDSHIEFIQERFIHFHNHNEATAKTKHQIGYPQVQYRIEDIDGEKYPAILVFGDCTRVIELLLMLQPKLYYEHLQTSHPLQLAQEVSSLEAATIAYSSERQYYRLRNYMPLNKTNTKRDAHNQTKPDNITLYEEMKTAEEKENFIAQLTEKHILSLASFLDIRLDDDNTCRVEQTLRCTKTPTSKNYLMDIIISTHLILPSLLAIGNNKSKDCGIIEKIDYKSE